MILIIHYLTEQLREPILLLRHLRRLQVWQVLNMDMLEEVNLEIVQVLEMDEILDRFKNVEIIVVMVVLVLEMELSNLAM